MDKLASMAMFIKVVDCGSFAGAAKANGMSSTMVGKYIRSTEQRLGARLLHRTTRRQTLTEVGALYYERCKQALAEVELADRTGAELQNSPRGLLRMTAPVGFGAECLTPAIAEYLSRYPDVQVDLTLDNGRPDLLGGGFELAIQMGDVFDDALVARPLRPYRRILAASHEYVARHGLPTHARELEKHICLGLSYWIHRDVWSLIGPRGERCDVKIRGRFTANYGGSLRLAAIHGIGIVLQPESSLTEDLATGRLVPILPDWSYAPTPMYLAYAQDRRPTAKLRSMIDFLLGKFTAQR